MLDRVPAFPQRLAAFINHFSVSGVPLPNYIARCTSANPISRCSWCSTMEPTCDGYAE